MPKVINGWKETLNRKNGGFQTIMWRKDDKIVGVTKVGVHDWTAIYQRYLTDEGIIIKREANTKGEAIRAAVDFMKRN